MLYSGVLSGSLTAVSFCFSFPPGSHMVLQDLNLRRITGIRCNTFSIPPPKGCRCTKSNPQKSYILPKLLCLDPCCKYDHHLLPADSSHNSRNIGYPVSSSSFFYSFTMFSFCNTGKSFSIFSIHCSASRSPKPITSISNPTSRPKITSPTIGFPCLFVS